MTTPTRCTRLAPTPSGPLHLGHAVSFLVAWGLARHEGWRIVLRIEDIDAARCRPEHEQSIRDCLRWLGLDWDAEVEAQAGRRPRHVAVMDSLCADGMAFHATPSRRELRAIKAVAGGDGGDEAAPHAGEPVLRFPPSMRPAVARVRFDPSTGPWRFRNDAGPTLIQDGFLGTLTMDTASVWGDPIVWTRSGAPSYQLAVTVDDGDDGVTDVVRGADLFQSAALQTVLHRGLGRTPPRWWHVPLVLDAGGARLAKRTGAMSLLQMKECGACAGELVARVASMIGLRDGTAPVTSAEFARLCNPATLREHCLKRRDGIVALP